MGPCILFKGFVNRFSASERRCFEGSPVQAPRFRCSNRSMAKKRVSPFPQQKEGCSMDVNARAHQLCWPLS